MRAKNSKNGDRGLTVVRALLLAAAVVLVVVLAYRQISRFTEARVPVWVSAAKLAKGHTVTAADLKTVRIPPPNGALVNRADIEGRALNADKPTDEPFYGPDLAPRPPEAQLTTTIPKDRLLATVGIKSLDLPAKQLMAGDRLDLLMADTDGVHVVAHDAYMLGLLTAKTTNGNGDSGKILGVDISIPGSNTSPNDGSALVLGLYPNEVFNLAAAEATGKKLTMVLHGANEQPPITILPKVAARQRAEPPLELLMGTKSQMVHVK